MSALYELIGRLVVWFVRVRWRLVVWFVRVRYGRQIRIALGVTMASLLLGGYLAASRKMEEG